MAGLLLWRGLRRGAGRLLIGTEGPPRRELAGWWVIEMITVTFAIFAVATLAALVQGSIGPWPLSGLVATDLGLAGGALLAWQLARRTTGEVAPEAMGLVARTGLGREALYGFLGLAIGTPAIVGVMLLTPFLFELFGTAQAAQTVLLEILALEGTMLAGAFVLASFVGPLLEEVLFRGFVQPACVDRVGPGGGILFTSILFASIHGADAMLPVFALSLVLGHLRHRTGGLTAPVVAHCLWNGTTLALALAGTVPVS